MIETNGLTWLKIIPRESFLWSWNIKKLSQKYCRHFKNGFYYQRHNIWIFSNLSFIFLYMIFRFVKYLKSPGITQSRTFNISVHISSFLVASFSIFSLQIIVKSDISIYWDKLIHWVKYKNKLWVNLTLLQL